MSETTSWVSRIQVAYLLYLVFWDCVEESFFCVFAATSFGNNKSWAGEDMAVASWPFSNQDGKYNDNNENIQSASLFISPWEVVRLNGAFI